MIANCSRTQYQPGQVVFVKGAQGQLKPAKIVKMSSYGTYKIKLYGSRDQEYARQYDIVQYSQETAQKIISQVGKSNKKIIKYLKSAEKDKAAFNENYPIQKPQNLIKQEQQQAQDAMNMDQNGRKEAKSMYEAIANIKVSILLEDCKNSKLTNFYFYIQGSQVCHTSNPKFILMKKLQWALEDLCLDLNNLTLQRMIVEIMDSELIQPAQYIVSPIYNKICFVVELAKKTKNMKFKNYLINRKADILLGYQNYLNNSVVFMRAKKQFDDFISGANKAIQNEKKQKVGESLGQESYRQLNQTD